MAPGLEASPPLSRPRPKIESLSDLVFGLALSVGAFALVSNPPATSSAFYRDIITFGFNFLVLITIWVRYTRIMSALPIETKTTLLLNCVLLFTVILEPFIFNILRLGNTANPPSVALFETTSTAFGFDLGAMMLLMAVFTLALADEEKKLVPASMIRQLRLEATVWSVSAAILFASAIPVFGRTDVASHLVTGVTVRSILWLGAIVVAWITWGIGREGAAAPSAPQTAQTRSRDVRGYPRVTGLSRSCRSGRGR